MNDSLQSIISGFANQRRLMLESLPLRPSGSAWCDAHSTIADRVVEAVHSDLCAEFKEIPPIAILATGGYGRKELAPYSDIDITVVPEDESSREVDAFIRRLFQNIHSAFETDMRLRVGYAYRLISDAPGLDATTRTGLLDSRLIAGSRSLQKRLGDALAASMPVGEFLIAKIREREEAFARHNETPLVVEPNLKEGAGGLRCFHCANWMREAIGERPSGPTEAFEHVLTMRNLLHWRAEKDQNLLSRSRQAELADVLNRDMYEMMSDLADAGLILNGEYKRTREKLLESRFDLSAGVTAIRGEARIGPHADGGAAAVGIALATELGLRIEESEAVATEGVSGPAAMFAISKGEATLRNLDRCGLLVAILPELTACRTLMPRDTAHEYTVFEHTLRAVRNIERLEVDSVLGQIKAGLNELGVLYLAALLHDVGKVDHNRSHSEVGERIALEVCARWGLGDDARRLVAWLVREHLSMARTIRLRDVMNPQTIEEFLSIVVTQEHLDLLTLLTYADIAAVSDAAWTPALEAFLLELYSRTTERLAGDVRPQQDPSAYRRRLMKELKSQDVRDEDVQAFVESLPAHYLVSTDSETVRLHWRFANRAQQAHATIDLVHQPALSATNVTVCALDSPGLLSRMLGVFYALDLTLVGLRACTTETQPEVALDVFTVSFGGRPVPSATARQLVAEMESVLAGKSVNELMRRKGKDTEQRQRLFQYSYVEGNPGIIEIRAPRGRGMAFRFSRLLAEQGWNVLAARVGQWADMGAAAFYVTGPGHKPLGQEDIADVLSALG